MSCPALDTDRLSAGRLKALIASTSQGERNASRYNRLIRNNLSEQPKPNLPNLLGSRTKGTRDALRHD